MGEKMIFEDHFFVESFMPRAMLHRMSEDEHNAYREPFKNGRTRAPILAFPRQIPGADGEPLFVSSRIAEYTENLEDADVKKLYLRFDPAMIGTISQERWIKENWPTTKIVYGGRSVHYAQEDEPEAIAREINSWMEEEGL